ncbi:MAG: ABC transporter ATP-binding protein [Thermococci archaeon]|nr:ABC transporter ATP-binding protein [Thermococci archaeon]
MGEKAVEVVELRKDYGKRAALRGISFNVRKGEVFGVIGPNGAGKSTTLKILATLLKPTSGEARVFGMDVVDNASRVRRVISYLPEEAGAYKNLKGIEYLRFMAKLYAGDDEKAEDMVKRGIEISGLGERLNDKVATYSKGMTRKLLLARALMVMPKLAILDEPASGLDVVNAYEIRKIIKDFSRKGVTFIVSSHNMLEVEFLCDRVVLMNAGSIVDSGTPHDLMAKYEADNLEEVFMRATCAGTDADTMQMRLSGCEHEEL